MQVSCTKVVGIHRGDIIERTDLNIETMILSS